MVREHNGQQTEGILVGPSEAKTGIVLAHGYSNLADDDRNACDWREKAVALAAEHYLVLAVNLHDDNVAEVKGAAAHLRCKGVDTPLFMGDGFGGTAVLTAAPEVKPQPAAVVTLSASVAAKTYTASNAVPRITTAVLFMASGYEYAADDARVLSGYATGARKNELIITERDTSFGVDLLDDPQNWRTVRSFLRSNAG